MKTHLMVAVTCAACLHAGFILFGGTLIPGGSENPGAPRQVELLSEEPAVDQKEDKDKTEEKAMEAVEEMKTESEEAPDAAEMVRNLEQSSAVLNAPKLEAASLSAIEAALNGQAGGGGEFAGGLTFASGGRIGGTGKPDSLEQNLDNAFSLAEIDQKPRAVFQTPPVYPAKMRSIEGVVTVIFIVDPMGKVSNPRVEKSTHPEFEKPAVDAVKQWKFEPAIKGGQRVSCKLRVPVRFQPKG